MDWDKAWTGPLNLTLVESINANFLGSGSPHQLHPAAEILGKLGSPSFCSCFLVSQLWPSTEGPQTSRKVRGTI